MLEFLTYHIIKTTQEQLKQKQQLINEYNLAINEDERSYILYKAELLQETIFNLYDVREWLLKQWSIEVEDIFIAISDLINFLWFNNILLENWDIYSISYDKYFVNDFFLKWNNLNDYTMFVEIKDRETWDLYEFSLNEFYYCLDYYEDWSEIQYIPLSLSLAFEQCYQNLTN